MSSGFVSGGTNEQPIERDDEWLEAQKAIEESRRRKAEESRQQDGKTLYETLQANKAAKQEAFEESIRLKNQFRSLDEDEVDFLDSVLESTRAHEAAVKRETTEQLELFRKQQEKVDAALVAADARKEALVATKSTDDAESELWTVGGRKRKKRRHDVQQGLKLRKTSSGEGSKDGIEETTRPDTMTSESQSSQAPKQNSKDTTTLPSIEEAASKAPSKSSDLLASPQSAPSSSMPANILGLSGYSSDEDD